MTPATLADLPPSYTAAAFHSAKQTDVAASILLCEDWVPLDWLVPAPPQAASVPPSRLTMRLWMSVLFNLLLLVEISGDWKMFYIQ